MVMVRVIGLGREFNLMAKGEEGEKLKGWIAGVARVQGWCALKKERTRVGICFEAGSEFVFR